MRAVFVSLAAILTLASSAGNVIYALYFCSRPKKSVCPHTPSCRQLSVFCDVTAMSLVLSAQGQGSTN